MNDPLIEILSCVTDVRREQAKRYGLAHILLFCIFGFLCGAKSYKALCSFIEEGFTLLQAAFPSKMKRAPARSTLWRIIGLVDGGSLEAVFRRHAAIHHSALGGGQGEVVAHDGKSLKGSYDVSVAATPPSVSRHKYAASGLWKPTNRQPIPLVAQRALVRVPAVPELN